MRVLSPNDVLEKGLNYVNVKHHSKSKLRNQEKLKSHYGSAPKDLANIWSDLMTHDPVIPEDAPEKIKKLLIIGKSEREERSFKMFMAVHYFVFVYDRNSELLSSRFDICE
jgi:hypothetical protein